MHDYDNLEIAKELLRAFWTQCRCKKCKSESGAVNEQCPYYLVYAAAGTELRKLGR